MMFWQTATRGFHPSLCTLLWTIIYVSVLFVENITQFRHFRFTHSYISFYWLESCVIALFCRIWGRKRIRSFRSRARHFFPFLAVHIAVVVMFGLDLNHFHQGTFFSSGGSESFCVSIALTAPLVLLATWVTNRQSYPDKIIIMVSLSCSLLMLMFGGLQDRITSYKMTFFDGVYGFMMAGSLAFFTIYGKEYLTKASRTELLYLLNVTSVVSLPFFALLFGEFSPLKDEIKKRGAYNVVHQVLVLVRHFVHIAIRWENFIYRGRGRPN
ncbi:uncharacterized protein [Montipora capricornis]|uniref:uncharacterized protein n=1 Tax=Montipora capricornis TaxID=246305 RepID=UPI0035F1083C